MSSLAQVLQVFGSVVQELSYGFDVLYMNPPPAQSCEKNTVYITPGRTISFEERGCNRVWNGEVNLFVCVFAEDREDQSSTLELEAVLRDILNAVDISSLLQSKVELCLPTSTPFMYLEDDERQGVAIQITYTVKWLLERLRPQGKTSNDDVNTPPSGLSGFSGYSGYSGATGPAGSLGLSGYSGYSGETGSNGSAGSSGFSGYSGASGVIGPTGPAGSTGTSGYSGYSGSIGASGYSGYSGPSGFSGYSGVSGYSGAGTSGFSGYSGKSGFSGYSGQAGSAGSPGAPGEAGYFGGDSQEYLFNSSQTTASDPGVGYISLNNADPAAVTEIQISFYNSASQDVSAWVQGLSNQGRIKIYDRNDPNHWALYELGGLPSLGFDPFYDILLTYISGDGTSSAFGSGADMVVSFAHKGADGATGISGFSGYSGKSGYSGYSGYSGSNGSTGTSGFSGYSGISGYSGYSGVSGFSGVATVTAVPGSDTTASGVIVSLTAGENLVFGNPVYMKSDGSVWKADADGSSTYPCIGMAAATISSGNAGNILLLGIARNDAWSWTVGGVIYLSITAGSFTQTQPAATDNVIQVLGVATAAARIYFFPDLTYITHT